MVALLLLLVLFLSLLRCHQKATRDGQEQEQEQGQGKMRVFYDFRLAKMPQWGQAGSQRRLQLNILTPCSSASLAIVRIPPPARSNYPAKQHAPQCSLASAARPKDAMHTARRSVCLAK